MKREMIDEKKDWLVKSGLVDERKDGTKAGMADERRD